jgi:hypothetical protein
MEIGCGASETMVRVLYDWTELWAFGIGGESGGWRRGIKDLCCCFSSVSCNARSSLFCFQRNTFPWYGVSKNPKTTDSCPPPLCSSSKNVKATAMSFVSHPPFPTHDIGIESTAQQAHVPLLLLKNGRTLGLWVCLELPPKGPIEMWSLVLPLK